MDPPDPNREMRFCERRLIEFARLQQREIKYFTGFSPAQFFGEQGMLVCAKIMSRSDQKAINSL